MKALDLTRRRMFNSGLIGGLFDAPAKTVGWHGAMQAQDYGPAKWSIGQRTTSVVDDDIDKALASGEIVRTHVLRPTWHFVAREDLRWLLALTGPRVHQSNGARYRELGLDERTLARCEGVIHSALEARTRLTRTELAGVLDDARIDSSGQRLPHILSHCELQGVICSGGLAGKQQTYALVDEQVPHVTHFDRDEALVELARRYLRSHGPATVQDLKWWSSLTVADIKRALHLLGPEVHSETIGDLTLWSVDPDESLPSPDRSGVHLLQAYDELVVGYTESRYFGDPRSAQVRAAWRDRTRPNGIVLIGSAVAGHWRRRSDQDSIRVEILLYEDPKPVEVQRLKAAAEKLADFVGREVTLSTATADG